MKFLHVRQYVDSRGQARIQFRPPQALKARGVKACSLPGPFGSPAFQRAYAAAMAAIPAAPAPKRDERSIDALVSRYLASPTYKALAADSRYRYRYELDRFCKRCGDRPAATMPTDVLAGIVSEVENLFGRRARLRAVRALFAWAVEQRVRPDNPTAGYKVPPSKSDGHYTWTDEEVDQYRAFHPYGTLARLAMELAYEAAARRGDVCLLGPAHVRNGRLEFRQKKTGGLVSIPLSEELRAAIAAYRLPPGAATFLQTQYGAARSPMALSQTFKGWKREAGLSEDCTLHGLRKAQLRFSAECGATEHELMAQGGHSSLTEVQRYTKMANRALMADRLAEKKRAVLETRSARVVAFRRPGQAG